MALNAFQIQGNTVLVAATSSTGQAATQISTGNVSGAYIANPSTALAIYFAIGSSAVAASVPTTTAPGLGMCIPSGTARTVIVPASSGYNWISAVTSAGTANGLFVTPGFGQ